MWVPQLHVTAALPLRGQSGKGFTENLFSCRPQKVRCKMFILGENGGMDDDQ